MIWIKRSEPAPRILVEGTSAERWRDEEVVNRLVADFHGKCYICEIHTLQDFNVEHLRPHKGGLYKERMYDWHNLFLSCPHCNGVKNKAWYADHVIDCCSRDPERLIEQTLEGEDVSVKVLSTEDLEAVMTAKLIEEVFMSDHPRCEAYGRPRGLRNSRNE